MTTTPAAVNRKGDSAVDLVKEPIVRYSNSSVSLNRSDFLQLIGSSKKNTFNVRPEIFPLYPGVRMECRAARDSISSSRG